jgi:hypothetical protein
MRRLNDFHGRTAYSPRCPKNVKESGFSPASGCEPRWMASHTPRSRKWNGVLAAMTMRPTCCYNHRRIEARLSAKARVGRYLGLVSRVTPVHTAVRNCTRDEGRSFEVGNQVLISSHRKLLSSKAMVVNVAEKSEQDFDRHD